MKILFVTSESAPFVRSGGLGDVAGALPKELNKLGNDTRIILPLYKEEMSDKFKDGLRFVGSTFVELSWRRQYCGVYEANYDGVTYYFIDNEYYFKRKGLYGHFDDGERFAFFSKAVLEALPLIHFYPEILHSNDWHTALTSVFLDVFYRDFEDYKNIKTVFTIHNIEFQGQYGIEMSIDMLGLPESAVPIVMNEDCVNYMKGGIEAASAVTTVSKTYAKEILDPFYSYGLEGILSEREYKVKGVVNGIDTSIYSSKTDPALFENYSLKTIKKKEENKKGLLEMIDMPYKEGRPVIGMITRLTEQKGMDLLFTVLDDIMRADIQFIVLGTGDWKYENMLKAYEDKYPNKFKGMIAFSSDLASKIYAGADMFLMPSKFEPCGLSQLIAMSYGTVPIVRETGGLKDTVDAFDEETGEGKGFSFKTYNAYDMLDAIWRAYACYFEKAKWKKVVSNCMKSDFSWKKSAKEYLEIYKSL